MSETTGSGTSGQNNYKDTLNLPRTGFEMKANLTVREPEMVKKWAAEDLYGKVRAARKGGKKWVLHDGPPYANGDIHMGHLINKVLKDIVVKFRTMQGLDSPYVPGWDCHGLPIESAIQKELGPKFRELSKDEVRKRCAEYAAKYVKLQGDSFQRLGVFGDFARPYLTMDKAYEGGILDVLAELVKRELVYRQKKPVHWCTNDRTALAEAELEYTNKKDRSIFVRFPIAVSEWGLTFSSTPHTADRLSIPTDGDVSLLIWTTTPWTLPANRAVAFKPNAIYALVRYDEQGMIHYVLVADELVDRVFKSAGKHSYHRFGYVDGHSLSQHTQAYFHPLEESRKQPLISGPFVTLEDGTGLVHIAPGHGKEDYSVRFGITAAQASKKSLSTDREEVYNPVLADGRYDDSVQEFLRGKLIWDANQLVVEKLRNSGLLFYEYEINHEYPHCWRCKKPVIFRATEQWFVSASKPRPSENDINIAFNPNFSPSPLWDNAATYVNRVTWIPSWGKNRIEGMLDTRPDWCISRQRSWGVPIPAVMNSDGRVFMTSKMVERVAGYFKSHGADSWYTDSLETIFGTAVWKDHEIGIAQTPMPFALQLTSCTKGQDILDVWFESGASHHAVLECTHPELGYPADMYLEGSDQHRGWFQSSLLEASGYKSEPPFREVLTHGFIVDEKGRKMSKSEGNDIKVNDALKQYGADVLRLWVSSVDYQNDIACGPNLLKSMGEAYRKIRNTIKYLLGNLYDFDPGKDAVTSKMHSIDRWMEGRVDTWARDVRAAYDRYEFHTVFKLIYEFCNVEISAVYAKAIKDRLYCELPTSRKRRASQTVCYNTLVRLIDLCAPVLVFTSEEAWEAVRGLPGCSELGESIHLRIVEPIRPQIRQAKHPFSEEQVVLEWPQPKVVAAWAILIPLIEEANKQLDELKKKVGGKYNTLDAEVVIVLPAVEDEVSKAIGEYGPEVEDALGVGHHKIEHGEIWGVKINDVTGIYQSCARSWKRRPDVGSDKEYPDLSARDAAVVRALRKV